MEQNIGFARDQVPQRIRGAAWFVAALALISLLGCGGNSRLDRENRAFTRVFTPQVPEFLSGPAGALLTNSVGFSARATFESITPLLANDADVMEGEFLAQGSHLLFAPRTSETAKKDIQLGGFSFIWDVAAGSGYVLSEALQGYAPVSSSLKITGATVQPGSERGEERALVTLDNGSGWLFRLWRTEPGLPPSRVSSVTNSPAFTLKLTKVRLEPPPANLFRPPEGFAKYANPEALADELAARKNTIRRGAWSDPERIQR